MAPQQTNPLQSDGALQGMMAELETIAHADQFMVWRKSFVDRLEEYLGDADGVEKARAADATVLAKMPKVDQAIAKIEGCIEANDDSGDLELKKGVKSQMALNKLKEACNDMTKRLTQLIPSNSAEIKACGYTKWNLGAVLAKDGFRIYADMMHHETVLQALVKVLEEAQVDRQIIEIIRYYFQRIRACIDVLSDLGLMRVMQRTREFVPDEKERPKSLLAEHKEAKAAAAAQAALVESSAPPPPATGDAPPDEAPGSEPVPVAPGAHIIQEEPEDPEELAPLAFESRPAPKTGDKVAPIVKNAERRQTINITTSNHGPRASTGGLTSGATAKRKPRRTKSLSGDQPDDLPRTAKPKAKAVLPGSGGPPGRGRGTGRKLSKIEAKEKKVANPYDNKKKEFKAPPRKSKSMDSTASGDSRRSSRKPRDKDEEEPPEQEEDDAEDENNEEEEEKKETKNDPKASPKKNPKGQGSAQPTKGGDAKNGTKPAAQAGKKGAAASAPAGAGPKRQSATNGAAAKAAPAKPKDNKVPIFVHTLDGRKITLKVDLTKDTLGHIKKLLEPKTQMPIANQRISGRFSGQHYELDEKKLTFYGVKEESDLDLDPLTMEIQAKVMPEGGKVITLPGITVETTCNMIKNKIAKETGIPAEKQELYFPEGNEVTNGRKTVKLMAMQQGSMVTVELLSKVPITVQTMDGKKHKLMVNLKNDSLADIKQLLVKETGIPVDNQRLLMDDKEILEKKGKITVKDYGIEEDAELQLEPKFIKISVEMPDGKTRRLKVTGKSDMGDLIRALVKTDTAIKKGKKHVLKFQDQEFPKGKTVRDMGLQNGSTIRLELTDD